MANYKKSERGFTLVELMVTIIVLGLAVVSLSGLYYGMKNAQIKSQYADLATRAAQAEIEVLRNNSYNTLDPGSTIDFTGQLPAGLPPGSSGTVAVSEPTYGLRRVDVTVGYPADGSSRKVELSSTIGVIGISQ